MFPIISIHPYKMDIYGCGCKDELQTYYQDTNHGQQEGISPFKESFYTFREMKHENQSFPLTRKKGKKRKIYQRLLRGQNGL